MLGSLSLELILSIASFALAIAGLAVRFFLPDRPAKHTLIAAVLIFILIISSASIFKIWEENKEIQRAAEDVVRIIGNEKRTLEDILADFRQPDYKIISDAIDLLIEEERVGSKVLTFSIDGQNKVRARLYFVRSFQSGQ